MEYSSFDPVFDQSKCDVPEVPPVSSEPFVDCVLPPEVEGILDCSDIDLPPPLNNFSIFVGLITENGAPGPKGPAGDPGEDGNDGSDGCDPILQISKTVICTYDTEEIAVKYDIFEVDSCVYELAFEFTVYCGYNYTRRQRGCCWWIWCPCEGDPVVAIPEKEECGFASPYCEEGALGEWTLIQGTSAGDCGETNPPCILGEYHGQVEIVCDCNPICYELTNCSNEAEKLYTTDPYFAPKPLGIAIAREPSAGGGCFYLSDKEAECDRDDVIEQFPIGFERASCELCTVPDSECVECGMSVSLKKVNGTVGWGFDHWSGTILNSITPAVWDEASQKWTTTAFFVCGDVLVRRVVDFWCENGVWRTSQGTNVEYQNINGDATFDSTDEGTIAITGTPNGGDCVEDGWGAAVFTTIWHLTECGE